MTHMTSSQFGRVDIPAATVGVDIPAATFGGESEIIFCLLINVKKL